MCTMWRRPPWAAIMALAAMVTVWSAPAQAYDPGDFDVVITTVYDPGNFTISGGAEWLITSTGGLTGYRVANIGNYSDGLVVTLGQLQIGSWSYIGRNGATGTVIVDESGSLATSGWLAMARDGGAVGHLSILGGTAAIGGNVLAPYGANGTAAIAQSGGSSTWSGRIYLGGGYGDGNGQIVLSGGTTTFNGQVDVGRSTGTATARLDVVGPDATISVGGSLYVYNGATLGFTIRSGGVSMIDVTSNATYLNGGTVEITLDGYTPSYLETFDLIESAGINISNLSLAAFNQGVWALQVNGAGDRLQAVYLVDENPYDPDDFDVVIDTPQSGNFTVTSGQNWLITDTGSRTGVGQIRNGLMVVLGDLSLSAGSYIGRYGTTGTLTVDMDGALSAASYLYFGGRDGSTGILNILDGTATFGTVCAPNGTNDTAVINQSGGVATWAGRVYLGGFYSGASSATMTISGGTATFSNRLDVGYSVGGGVPVRLDVVGSDATITVSGSLYVHSGATLGFEIGPDGVSMINVTSNTTTLNGGTVEISLAAGYTPEVNERFDLIKSIGIDITNLQLAAANQGVWTLQTGPLGDRLQAVYGEGEEQELPPGAVYYIDYASGSDANSGLTKQAPWKRHPYMQNFAGTYTAGAGDEFVFKGGVTWPSECFGLIVTQGGSEQAPMVYTVDETWYSGGAWSRPVFDMQEQAIVGDRPVYFYHASHVVFDGIEIKNQRIAGASCGGWGGITVTSSTDITVTDCYVHSWYIATPTVTRDNNFGGFYVDDSPTTVIDGCVVHGQEVDEFPGLYSGNGFKGSGMVLNSEFYNLPNGMHIAGGVVSGCEIHHIYTSYDSGTNVVTPPNGRHANGVWIFASGTLCNSYVHDVLAPGAPIVFPAAGWGGADGTCLIYNNVIRGNIHINGDGAASGNQATWHIYNNTIGGDSLNNAIVASKKNDNALGHVVIKNNVLVTPGSYPAGVNLGQPVADLVIDNNVYYAPSVLNRVNGEPCVLQLAWLSPTRYNLAGSQGLGYNANSYLSPIALYWDYVPSSTGDPGVDDGADLSAFFDTDCLGISRPQGSAFDIGAYELDQ
ncbi:MAG: hypothetical protein GXY74_13495 [Phycisphaerae bacterium]|nr:hypothetical protein [Phycisphaerae bacterium]